MIKWSIVIRRMEKTAYLSRCIFQDLQGACVLGRNKNGENKKAIVDIPWLPRTFVNVKSGDVKSEVPALARRYFSVLLFLVDLITWYFMYVSIVFLLCVIHLYAIRMCIQIHVYIHSCEKLSCSLNRNVTGPTCKLQSRT